jgi:hypothetical protein
MKFPLATHRFAVSTPPWCALLVGATLAACGGVPTERTAPTGPGLHLISGATATDSAWAPVAAPLVVELRDSTGRPVPGVQIEFTASELQSPEGANGAGARVPAIAFRASSTSHLTFSPLVLTTDAAGRASTLLQFQAAAGSAAVVVTTPAQGRADTAHFTIRPGRAVGVRALPADTALYPARRSRSAPPWWTSTGIGRTARSRTPPGRASP